MIAFVNILHIYNQFVIRILRFIIFTLLLVIVLLILLHGGYPHVELFLLSSFVMIEIFVQVRLMRMQPPVKAGINDGKNIYASCTLMALEAVLYGDSMSQVIPKLLKGSQIHFMLEKADLSLSDVTSIDIPKSDVMQRALLIARDMHGDYVTTVDVLAAYLLLTESQTKLLFGKKLKEESFMHIVYWARVGDWKEEHPGEKDVTFWGEGIAENWIAGWTYETAKYISDLTQEVYARQPVFVGRKKEYQLLTEILSGSSKNSAIVIGETGVGKNELVEAIALDSARGVLKGNLYHKRFYQLNIGALLAGVNSVGDLEGRLQPIMDEISHAGNLILFIPDLENIVGASTFHLDLSGALFPFLRNGKVRVVGTITPSAYKQFIESKSSFSDVFQDVVLEEPSKAEALEMLLEQAHAIEKKEHVSLTYQAIISSLDLSKRFLSDHVLPGSAISLLEAVSHAVSLRKKRIVEEEDVVAAVENKTHIAVATPDRDERDLLLHLEDKLHERVVDQEEAISAIGHALRRIRSGMVNGTRPISFLFLGPTGVGKTETARALAALYYGGEDKMIRLDMSEYSTDLAIKRLLGSAPGEGDVRGELTEKVREHPFSLLLLDEFEKANPEILNLFLQVLDDGRLTDNRGKTISFVNTIIIATSNAGSEFIREELAQGTIKATVFQQELLELLQSKGIFKPELLNRFDDVIAFKPLGQKEITAIASLLLRALVKKLSEQDITISLDESVLEKTVKEGFDQEFGARPLRRFIQSNIEDVIAEKIIKGEIGRGANVTIKVDDKGNLLFV